jgi:outer membrane protein OmpA-like peptidoglycan-associated protein
MNTAALRIGVALACFVFPIAASLTWVGSAEDRLEAEERAVTDEGQVAVAAAANEEYCTVELKRVLRRVLKSCGLLSQDGANARGCQPVDAKTVATMSGDDFNALFLPMKNRGGIVQFEQGEAALDDGDRQLIDQFFADQRGASYFFIVARASPEGAIERNRALSQERAEALMQHLRERFDDPGLEREVGLLWLGEEFAQLDPAFCEWQRSSAGEPCSAETINRSAFVAWIDCRL